MNIAGCFFSIVSKWLAYIQPLIFHTDCFRIPDIAYQSNRLPWGAHANRYFGAKRHKFKMTGQCIRYKAAAFVAAIEPDFPAQ